MTGATGVAVVQATSVLASISPQTTELGPILPVDLLCTLQSCALSPGDLLQRPDVLGITLRLVPLVYCQHPQDCRHPVGQRPHGQASGG